jgi:hypothetical protein
MSKHDGISASMRYADDAIRVHIGPQARLAQRGWNQVPKVVNTVTAGTISAGVADDNPILPFTPEWYAREGVIDEKLKRVMRICDGC